MIYFITQEWGNTKGNHAGMVYLYRKLHEMDCKHTRTIVLPKPQQKVLFILEVLRMLFWLILGTRSGDKILFTECLSRRLDQVYMAKIVKTLRPSLHVSCMVHLIPEQLEKIIPKQNYASLLSCMDKIITLGSTWLTEWRINSGKVDLTKVPYIIITDTYEEAFDQGFSLDNFEPISKSENIGDHRGLIANGKFKRDNYSISSEEIKEANGMTKKGLQDLIAKQHKGDEENWPLLVEYNID